MSGSGNDPVEENRDGTFLVAVPAANAVSPPLYGYMLRLGTPNYDASTLDVEDLLADAAGKKLAQATEGKDARRLDGITIYSRDNYTVTSPTITMVADAASTWASDSVSVTTNGGRVSAASYSGSDFLASYASVAQMSINNSDLFSLNGGNTMTVWAGNDASTGVGGLLWSNYGATQNIFGGQVVNVTQTGLSTADIEVQGIGSTKITPSVSMIAQNGISLSVSPVSRSAQSTIGYADKLKMVTLGGIGVASALLAVNDLAMGLELDSRSDDDTVKAAMRTDFDVTAALTGAIVVLQAMGALSGALLKSASEGYYLASNASLDIAGNQASLYTGSPAATQGLVIATARSASLMAGTIPPSANGFRPLNPIVNFATAATTAQVTVDSTVNPNVQIAANRVTVTANQSLSLQCGAAVSITMTPGSIQITAPTINLSGANQSHMLT